MAATIPVVLSPSDYVVCLENGGENSKLQKDAIYQVARPWGGQLRDDRPTLEGNDSIWVTDDRLRQSGWYSWRFGLIDPPALPSPRDPFRSGDVVTCIDQAYCRIPITFGRKYRVDRVVAGQWVYVRDEQIGSVLQFALRMNRFKLYAPAPRLLLMAKIIGRLAYTLCRVVFTLPRRRRVA